MLRGWRHILLRRHKQKGHKAVCFNFIEFVTVAGDETGLTSQLLLKGYTTPPWSMPTTLYKQQCGFYTLFLLALTCKKNRCKLKLPVLLYLIFCFFYFSFLTAKYWSVKVFISNQNLQYS